jgi:hypothetical protein
MPQASVIGKAQKGACRETLAKLRLFFRRFLLSGLDFLATRAKNCGSYLDVIFMRKLGVFNALERIWFNEH